MAYAIYRLPHADRCTLIRQTSGEPTMLPSCAELSGQEGFVLAPFDISTENPVLLIRPDSAEQLSLATAADQAVVGERCANAASQEEAPQQQPPSAEAEQSGRLPYSIDFANFHSQLMAGEFQKLVLARRTQEQTKQPIAPQELFLRACARYPRMFIALVTTRLSGTWLIASPEVLLDGEGGTWRTMALAGTMRYSDNPQWNDKNRTEQQMVATYITETLEQFSSDFSEEGPYSARAANLVHLRSDFSFSLNPEAHIGDLLQALHPTPAVCGLPKQAAFDFIRANESAPRRYYSGFMGPLFPKSGATHLYVSLRCMEIAGNSYQLYAGGGILAESQEEQEWQETEMKLETMRQCLATEKT